MGKITLYPEDDGGYEVRARYVKTDYPIWLLLMFVGSFAGLGAGLLGVCIEAVVVFPEPPVISVWVAAIATSVNILSIYLAKRMRKKRDV